MMDVITYPCGDSSRSMLVKRAPVLSTITYRKAHRSRMTHVCVITYMDVIIGSNNSYLWKRNTSRPERKIRKTNLYTSIPVLTCSVYILVVMFVLSLYNASWDADIDIWACEKMYLHNKILFLFAETFTACRGRKSNTWPNPSNILHRGTPWQSASNSESASVWCHHHDH